VNIRIGTRGSDLALWQAHHVKSLLERAGAKVDILVLKTRGDLIDNVPLSKVEGKAFFTAEIERALLDREVDIAVHSHKDLPTEMTPGLVIAAVPPRASHHERLLVRPDAHDPHAPFLPLKRGARVGTSAPRRLEQLKTLRPDLQVLDLRGNVPTRVRKAREGVYDAVVLAAAGLDRLQLATDGLVAVELALDTFVPAPAQGALAVQVRAEDSAVYELCRACLHDAATEQAIAAERSLLVGAGGGCSLPLAAAVLPDGEQGFLAHGFLGAGHPAGTTHARWVAARGKTPSDAMKVVLAELVAGRATRTGPLCGLTIALAGSAHDGSQLGERLAALGADVRTERVIELEPIAGANFDAFLARARSGDVLAVTSRQAAHMLAGRKVAAGVRFAAVGRSSARELASAGFEVTWTGDSGARELAGRIEVAPGGRVYWPCAQDALPDLADALAARGIALERLPIYRTSLVRGLNLERELDVRVYMSPSAVEAALEWERAHPGRATVRFALGSTTAAALRAAGLDAVQPACTDNPITEELVAGLHQLVRSKVASR
jgi:hydroxymethylbilane synthase